MEQREDLIAKIQFAIDQLRPFLNDDGGDMEFVQLREDGIVEVRLLGACSDCSMSNMTIKAGIEESLIKVSEEIKGVVAID